MTSAQEPAQNESERIVNDDPLNLLGEALFLVLVMFRHLASPASDRMPRYSRRSRRDRVEPGGTPSRL